MARGHPDHGQAQQTIIINSVSDLGELAARINSPSKFHRGGNVIFLTDFSRGIERMTFSTGLADPDHYLYGGEEVEGGVALCLENTNAELYVRPIELTTIGFELGLALVENVSYFNMSYHFHLGSISDHYGIAFFPGSDKIKFFDNDDNWSDLLSYSFDSYRASWFFNIKLIVDIKNRLYRKLFFNHEFVDMSDESPGSVTGLDDDLQYFSFGVSPTAGKVAKCYINYVVITINEI